MSPKILITGDRSMHPVMAVELVARVLPEINERCPGVQQHDIITGDCETGVERAVRYLLPVSKKFSYPMTEEGKPDFDEAYEDLVDDVVLVVILHTDPLTSSVTKAIFRHFPESRVWIPLITAVTLDT